MQVGLIGAGNMARALALGWGEPVLARDSGSGRARALVAELGGEALRSNAEVAERADVVVLCHKPRQFVQVSREIGDKVSIVASVLGGVSVENLQEAYPGAQVFRLMPNTPVEVRHGIICYAPADGVDTEVEARVLGLFERLGIVVACRRALIEAAAAVMSVGPAYQALLAEAQVDAAVRNGSEAEPRLAAGRGDDGRDRRAARDARLRHARSPARGDLAGGVHRPRTRGARARRRAHRISGRDGRRPRPGAIADDDPGEHPRHDIANYVSALFLRLHPADLRLHPAQPAVLVRRAAAVLAMVRRSAGLPARRVRALSADLPPVHPADRDVRLSAR